MEIPKSLYNTIVEMVDMRVREIKVTRTDFEDLKSIVRNLAEAQARTELKVEDLVEAQARTERRIEQLAEAQARTERKVEQLAEAQARTERKVEQLAEAQARTERKVEELAEAQKELAQAQTRTEQELKKLAKQVGGLSERLGGSLEDLSYDVLPACIEKYYQIEVDELTRDYLVFDGREIEFNVLGKGIEKSTGKQLTIIGEVKTNITLQEVKHFLKQIKIAQKHLKDEIFPVMFGFRARLDARALAKQNDIRLFATYGKEIK